MRSVTLYWERPICGISVIISRIRQENIDSKILLRDTMKLLRDAGYELGNIDATVAAERPKLNPHIPLMKKTLAEVMNVDEEDISIKATTTEKLGFTGRQEGISAYATVLIQRMGS